MPSISEILSRVLRENNFFTAKDTVNNKSFLHIKSFPSDNGGRPLDETQSIFWEPDLRMVPEGITTFPWLWWLHPRTTYTISCTLSNTGDLAVTAANLEFFQLAFSGDNYIFDPRVDYSAKLDVDQPLYSVLEHSKTVVSVKWNSKDISGPMAIAARVTSQSPVDLPADWDSLNPRQERHCANYVRFRFFLSNVLTFSDKAKDQDSESEYQYSMMPTSSNLDDLKSELSRQGVTLKKAPRSPEFQLDAQISTATSDGGVPSPIALRPSSAPGGMISSLRRRWSRSRQWDFNVPKAAKITISMKPLNIQLTNDQVIAYDLIKRNRKTNKEEGRVTILYAQE